MPMRVYAALPADHPLVTDTAAKCGKCHEPFRAGERITLQPLDLSSPTAVKEALPIHARCVLVGREAPNIGRDLRIIGIEEGSGVWAPVILTGGVRVTFRQIGIESNE